MRGRPAAAEGTNILATGIHPGATPRDKDPTGDLGPATVSGAEIRRAYGPTAVRADGDVGSEMSDLKSEIQDLGSGMSGTPGTARKSGGLSRTVPVETSMEC
jgi:hypothetical protein